MRKRSIIKAVSALAVATIMTVGVSATAFAAELSVDLDFKAPDGSAVQTTTVEGKTVYLLPPNATFTVASTNGGVLGVNKTVTFLNMQEVGNTKISGMGWELSDLLTGTVYNMDAELSSYPLINAIPHKKYGGYSEEEPWDSDLGYMKNDGQIDINNLPEYHYFEMTIYDQDGDANGSINYYFKFAKDAAVATVTSAWVKDTNGWWIKNSDGSYVANSWYQDADEKWYYMGEDGYMLTNTTTPDGYPVNTDGVWVQ